MIRPAQALLDFLYPARARCVGCGSMCGQRWEWLCEACAEALDEERAGAFSLKDIDYAYAAYSYAAIATRMVRAYKFEGLRRMARTLALEMLEGVELAPKDETAVLTPVPLHPAREKARGFNQAALLADALAKESGLPHEALLSRVVNTPQQSRLSREQRSSNVKGAFQLSGDVKGRTILLIDDVCTTGTTARECAKTLRAGGAARVILICYARA